MSKFKVGERVAAYFTISPLSKIGVINLRCVATILQIHNCGTLLIRLDKTDATEIVHQKWCRRLVKKKNKTQSERIDALESQLQFITTQLDLSLLGLSKETNGD